jgi:hypothetical protein
MGLLSILKEEFEDEFQEKKYFHQKDLKMLE